ncbi:aspartyl-phosphate phosphatase Spo0E family protein [Domibacillus sp. DTU_2020_1001157_1_SI_ALB_TIR_016]|uniref:aspartyl-phosphate phosphatase Spo0E family protein n=1 Tax=Domibacillus sp. DTU_2020_1001157_1_SI_ALB_TIR_016 TaxID=3077789 RepID=UPI0028E68E26|nr:aspartyl-phosphate phosphatase Spo0E family protein [Domibacillus sp. DTU_2020_1001157_1_SI_ALB_TIR_016]WNS79629.1 aspartyl-phosphate phosphatase Spo0E family protein [Domibacillus sp. DTU_2020_1001157_1_SI_ALB_TIR_016]
MNIEKDGISYLLLEIEKTRELLNAAIQSHGISSQEALDHSEELNKLILHVQLHNRKAPCYT